jgi:hypothetical protein
MNAAAHPSFKVCLMDGPLGSSLLPEGMLSAVLRRAVKGISTVDENRPGQFSNEAFRRR